MERLRRTSNASDGALVACDAWLGTLLHSWNAGTAEVDFPQFASGAGLDLLQRFEPLFRDPRLFVQEAKEPRQGRCAFIDGKSLLRWQSLQHLELDCQRHNVPVGILPPLMTADGCAEANCFVAAASAITPFPDETAQFLCFLAEEDTQRTFCEAGHVMSHRGAMAHFQHPLLGKDAAKQISACLERSVVPVIKHPFDFMFVLQVVNYETVAWQAGRFNADELVARIRRRAVQATKSFEAGRFREAPIAVAFQSNS